MWRKTCFSLVGLLLTSVAIAPVPAAHAAQPVPGHSGLVPDVPRRDTPRITTGEITDLEPPHSIVFHWWETDRAGRLKFEGWPGYRLESVGDDETRVRHHARLLAYGVWALGRPIWRRFAVKERTITIDGLKASFEG